MIMADEVEIERMVVRLIGDSQSYMQMMKDSQTETKKAHTELAALGTKIEAIGSKIRGVGLGLSLAITAPLTAIGYKAQSEFTEFEAALSRMEGLVGIAGDEVARFRGEILSLAGPVAKSPVELAKAMEFITGSGIKGNAALETLTITAKAASAGLGETVEVANAVTSAMNAYGPANLDAAKATDILVATVREGKAEASSFAPVFGQVLPLAAEMGVSFGEVGGALAFLTRTTGNASIATTQLRSMMTQLMKPTEKSEKALKAMGITGVDVSNMIKQKGLITTLNFLKEKLGDAGLEIKDLIGDTEGLMGALQFTGPQAQIAADMIKTVNAAAGDTQKAFDAAAKTAKFSFAQAMAETKIILIELGEVIAPVMGQMISYTKMAMKAWKELSPETKQNIVLFAAIAATVGPVVVMLGTLVTSIGTLIGAFAAIKAAIGATLVALGLWNSGLVASQSGIIAYSRNLGLMTLASKAMAVALTGGIIAVAATVVYQLSRMIAKTEEFNESLKKSQELAGKLQSRFQQETGSILEQAGGMTGDQKTNFLTQELARAKQQVDGYKEHVKSAKADIADAGGDPNRPMKWLMGDADARLAQESLAQSEQQLKDAEARAQAIEAELKKGMQASSTVVSKPNTEKFDTKKLFEYTEGLKAQLSVLQQEATLNGAVGDSLEIVKFKREGASEAQLQAARDTNEAIVAQQKQNDLNKQAMDIMANLEDEILGLGMKFDATTEDVELFKLATKGANLETLKDAHALVEQKKALQESRKLWEEGAELKKKHIDPAQKMRDEQVKLNKMLEMGAIDGETYRKALEEIQKQTKKDYKVEFKTSGTDAVLAGSAEAMERLREYQFAISGAGPLPGPEEAATVQAKTGKAVKNPSSVSAKDPMNEQAIALDNTATEISETLNKGPFLVIAEGIKRLVALAEEKNVGEDIVEFVTSGLSEIRG